MHSMQHLRVPFAIQPLVEGYQFQRIRMGESAACVFRLSGLGQRPLFLKCAVAGSDAALSEEAERLRWLVGRAPVPDVIAFLAEGDWEYLLVGALPGRNGVDAGREHPTAVVAGLADALRLLHAQPFIGCPFDQSLDAQIERARHRVEAGMVDEGDFDEEHRGRTAVELLIDVEKHRPTLEDKVLTHGDACLPKVIFEGDRFIGFIDCSRAGLADRYQDLALASRSIARNLGPHWIKPFFAYYGLPEPDESRLVYYRLLDEFF